jgi:hypothetical protein
MRRMFAFVLVLAASISSATQLVGQRSEPTFAFIHAAVIDGTGAALKRDQTVVVTGDRITAVGSFHNTKVPPGVQVFDGTGRVMIPGLWDAHVHTRYVGIDHLRLFVANGITSVRNMSAPWDHLSEIRAWRDEIRAGRRIGPRILTSGPVLDGPGAGRNTSMVVAEPEEGRQAVQRIRREGADFVKVYNLLSRESYFAIAAESRAQQLPFEGHIPLAINTTEAVAAGQRTIEHADPLLLGASDREQELRQRSVGWRPDPNVRRGPIMGAELIESFNAAKLSALADRLREKRVAVVPTLVAFRNRFDPPKPVLGLEYVPSAYLDSWKRMPPTASQGNDRLLYKHFQRVLKAASDTGVTILAGTDVGVPFEVSGFSLHEELSLLVNAGLSEMKVLQAATRDPARAFNITDQGTIERGMRADLLLLDANPLQNIENTRRIRTVVVAGRVLQRSDLDRMLEEIHIAATQWQGVPTR